MEKTPAEQFADKLGRANIATATGVVVTAVSNAVVRGWFPPSWFVACKVLAESVGEDCPPALFGMRGKGPQYVEKVNGVGPEYQPVSKSGTRA